jgi:uncharacterized membrane protein
LAALRGKLRRSMHQPLASPSPHDPPPPKSKLITFRNAFISGALLLAPLGVTIWVFAKIVDVFGGTVRPLYEPYFPKTLESVWYFWGVLDIVATLIVLLLVAAFGYLSSYVFGKYFVSVSEAAIQRIPGVGAVYNSVKQIVATFGTQNRNMFNKVVLVEFPRKGAWTLAFLSNREQGEVQSHLGPEMLTVFVPTTPNPTGGYMLILPRQEVIELEMSVGDGMKMIISGGAVVPPWSHERKVEAITK